MLTKAEVYLGLVALALLAWRIDIAHERADAVRGDRASQAVRVVKHFTDSVKVLDPRYAKDSAKFAKQKTRYDTTRVHDTLPVIVERPGQPDTVRIFIPRDVADSALAGCTSLLHSCDIRLALKDSIIAGQQRQLAFAPKPRGFLATWTERLASAGVGYGLCSVRGGR